MTSEDLDGVTYPAIASTMAMTPAHISLNDRVIWLLAITKFVPLSSGQKAYLIPATPLA